MVTSHPRRSRGFTLIELVVVITIIAIASAMIIPEMKGTFQDALLRSTSRELANALNVASSEAVSHNQTHRFHLDATTGRYLVERRTHEPGQEEFTPLKGVEGCEGALDSRIAVRIQPANADQPESADSSAVPTETAKDESAKSADVISFNPDGTADAVEIVLRDQQGFRLALRVNPTTARVRVVEMDRE